MTGIYFLIPTLMTVFISFLVVRAGAIALMMTGMDRSRAVFQALSAFTGTGFTTSEAESITRNFRRRRIISIMMILGNAGIVTVFITATSSVVMSRGFAIPINVLLLVAGIYIVYRIANIKGLIKKWESYVEKLILRRATTEGVELESVMGFIEGYGLVKGIVLKGSSLIDKSLEEIVMGDKRLRVLGVERKDNWIPFPEDDETVVEGDKLIFYGPINIIMAHFRN
jgi:hypothetical protein